MQFEIVQKINIFIHYFLNFYMIFIRFTIEIIHRSNILIILHIVKNY